TGVYHHYGLAQRFDEESADQTLRESHLKAFSEWLCFALAQQKADLDLYLCSLEGDRRNIVATWIRLSPYKNLLPDGVRAVEQKLYTVDLEVILELLKNEY